MLRNRRFHVTVLGAAVGVVLASGLPTLASAAPGHRPAPKPTVVLVHGAWSDSASWSGVVKRLQAKGYPVTAVPTPLRGLSDDSAYLASYLKTVQGPVILVGQSYGGSVITDAATGNTNVKALVYISAFAPDKGESAADLAAKFPGSHITDDPDAPLPTALNAVPLTLADGTAGGVDLYVKPGQYRDLFFGDHLGAARAAELAATQRPITLQALGEASGTPAWRTIPSWYLVSKDDHLIPPAAERFMAARAHSHTVEARTPHAAQVTDPGVVTDLIESAADGTR
ncbi:alpha/beta fold hydrolase [Streptomyces liangshanensis]|uniref:Alpha/beta hydrolase n=1 Tax=Streptomyces liangshanensis TaxID=2717324 RepID=A0A6G9H7N9_9ACTN|nr:alpha/beta hydrolase [Streptomyces liangshanensis]QIQ06117.1 alpha/beta hydrolase [Streptomyces liangshanensis]